MELALDQAPIVVWVYGEMGLPLVCRKLVR
jgi:hypothetical protein